MNFFHSLTPDQQSLLSQASTASSATTPQSIISAANSLSPAGQTLPPVPQVKSCLLAFKKRLELRVDVFKLVTTRRDLSVPSLLSEVSLDALVWRKIVLMSSTAYYSTQLSFLEVKDTQSQITSVLGRRLCVDIAQQMVQFVTSGTYEDMRLPRHTTKITIEVNSFLNCVSSHSASSSSTLSHSRKVD